MNIKQKLVQVTKTGLASLNSEYRKLIDVKRPHLVDRLSKARLEGDLAENSDYINAKEELEFLDGRIAELEEVIKNAKVISPNGNHNGIGVGTKVTLKANGTKNIFEIVGEWEADPVNKKISHESPLGKALVGRKVGDSVDVEAPAGKISYEVLAIE